MGCAPTVTRVSLVALCLGLVLAACGGATVEGDAVVEAREPDRTDPSAGGSSATDVPPPREVEPEPVADPDAAAGCPSTFAEAQRGRACANGSSECTYDEGSCYCGEPRECSGAIMEPRLPSTRSWQCQAAVRPDGCPGRAPDEGSPCSVGQSCGYGRCGGPVYGCVDGGWQMVDFVSPPP